jgi:hypothetical protein
VRKHNNDFRRECETERLVEINGTIEEFVDEIGIEVVLAMVAIILCDREAARG